MKLLSSISLIPALAAAALLTGCDAWVGYRHVPYDPNNQPPREEGERAPAPRRDADEGRHVREVRGTVTSVDTHEQVILVQPEGGDRGDRDRDLVLHYDEGTRVEYRGQSFGPENLERGDQVSALVERGSEGLRTEAIQVLHNVRGDDERGDDRGDEQGETMELRGTVRSNDTHRQVLEIEGTGPGADKVIAVGYDDDTEVEFQGRFYGPENLERGDAVEIELRDDGGKPFAERILVVGEGRPVRT